jgi:hypothetical protein
VHSLRDALAAERIDDFHRRTGGPFGRLGASAGPLARSDGGSYTQSFQLGRVDLADIDAQPTAVTTFEAEVSLAAVRCFGTQDSDTDETYAVISVISVDPNFAGTDELVLTKRTAIQENVHAGDVIFKATTLSPFARGFPGSGIGIHVAIWDHESGDADDITKQIHDVLSDAANKGASALAGAAAADDPGVTGGTIGDITQFQIGGVRPFDVLTLGAAKLLAGLFADDLVGEHQFLISAQKLIDLSDPAKFNASLKRSPDLDSDVVFNWPPTPQDEVLLSDGDGSYKVYFKVRGISTSTPVEGVPTQ